MPAVNTLIQHALIEAMVISSADEWQFN